MVASAKKTGAVVVAENHNVIGGLTSAVCEVLMEEYPVPLRAVGVKDRFGQVGKNAFPKRGISYDGKGHCFRRKRSYPIE